MWYYVILDPLGRWNTVGVQRVAGAQVLRASALGLAPFGLCFLPMASGVF